MLDDREVRRLILLTAERDASAFEKLYRIAAPLLLGVAQRIVGRREVAEEVLHDCFVKIWRAASTFDPMAAQPVAWIVAIARNRAIDLVSSADVARVDLLGDDTEETLEAYFGTAAEDAVDAGRMKTWLRQCLEELRPAERQALVLSYNHGLSHGDLAKHLQKPLGTVKAWVRRAVDNLRTCIEQCTGESLEARRAP
jgi:RNA polymerase sigma-70 factor (ECF subfamily)